MEARGEASIKWKVGITRGTISLVGWPKPSLCDTLFLPVRNLHPGYLIHGGVKECGALCGRLYKPGGGVTILKPVVVNMNQGSWFSNYQGAILIELQTLFSLCIPGSSVVGWGYVGCGAFYQRYRYKANWMCIESGLGANWMGNV